MLRNWNFHLLLVETQNGPVAVKISLVIPQKMSTELPYMWFMGSQRVRHDWATELNWTEQFYSELYIQGTESRYSSQHLRMRVHNSTIHGGPKVETIQTSTSW